MLSLKYLFGTAVVITMSHFVFHHTEKEEKGLVEERNKKMWLQARFGRIEPAVRGYLSGTGDLGSVIVCGGEQ
ncbi:MAG: hypothetical protein KJ804_18345 [Proteobacteria bacterium]|nr:hypothetical protein [Pseudomonadota bacterium]